jgi:aspartyl-tRNA synthetase
MLVDENKNLKEYIENQQKTAHKNIYRTHTCGELRITDVNKEVRVCGWVDTIRKLGGITFVTIRDNYGLVQVLFKDESMLDGICKETTVTILGTVQERSSKNPKMVTGDIEIVAKEITVLGKCKNVLPFEVSSASDNKDDLRLKYRYLDLRNPVNHERIILRASVLNQIRSIMTRLGFTEVQTPILTSSSPEGARDFLVPSRLNPGQFYALPQSPQQFKQLLMISGFDKYFQIAPCFRDEDARADRSPGEFYQMDCEMSFATQEDVMNVIETVLYEVFSTNTNKEVTKPHFVHIPYFTSMDLYCTDKPDLRNPLIIKDLSNVFASSAFNAFKGKTVKCICAPTGEKPRSFYDNLSKFIVDYEGKGLAYIKVLKDKELNGSIVKFLSEDEKSQILNLTEAKEGDSLFFLADDRVKCVKLAGILRNELGSELDLIDKNKFYFCFVVDFPFFEWDYDNNCIAFAHNPFSMPQGGMKALTDTKDPLTIKAYQFDCVLNGVELLSGAVRNHDPEIMVKAFEMVGYDRSVVVNKFPALFNAFQYGAPPHAGAAFGVDRVIMFLAGCDMIRDIIAFPFNKNAQDLMMGAPSEVTDKQLKDVSVKVDLPKKDN